MASTKTAEKSQAILNAAAKVFLAREFHEVLIDDVAAEAGTGKGTIYRYFPTKEELFFVSVLHGLDGLSALDCPAGRRGTIASAPARDRGHGGPPVRLEPPGSVDAAAPRRAPLCPEGSEFNERRQRIVRLVRDAISEGIARGELRPIDSTTGAELFLGMLRGLNVFRRDSDTIETIVAESLDVFWNGVGRRAMHARRTAGQAIAVVSPRRSAAGCARCRPKGGGRRRLAVAGHALDAAARGEKNPRENSRRRWSCRPTSS